MKLTLSHRLIGTVLLVAFVAAGTLGPVANLLAMALALAAWVFFRWPQYGVALLVAGTVTNLFGVASNTHGLPGIQAPLTLVLALILFVRWVAGKIDWRRLGCLPLC